MRIFSLNKPTRTILCIIFVISILAQTGIVAFGYFDYIEGDFEYSIEQGIQMLDGVESEITYVRITSYYGQETDITIPEELGGYPVRHVNLQFGTNDDGLKITTFRIPSSVDSVFIGGDHLTDIYWDKTDAEVYGDTLRNHAGVKFHLKDAVVYACENAGDYSAEIHKDYAVIYGYNGNKTNVVVPSTILDMPVKAVTSDTFQGNKSITAVTFPQGIVSIEGRSFVNCTKLKTVTLPSTVTEIGYDAFHNSAVKDIYYDNTEAEWIKAVTYEASTGPTVANFNDTTIHLKDFTVKNITTDAGLKAAVFKTFVIVYGYTGKSNSIVIPATINKKPVKQVDSGTFSSNKNATAITISEGVQIATIIISNHNNKSLVIKIPSTIKGLYYFEYGNFVKQVQFNGTKAQWIRLTERSTVDENIKFLKTLSEKTLNIKSVTNSVSGAKITWSKIDGADYYLVYRKTSTGWKRLAKTSKTTYTDSTVKSGKTYTYTVKAASSYNVGNKSGNEYSKYNKTGVSVKYLAAPEISEIKNSSTGLTLKWNKIAGATGYFVYVKTSSGWKRIKTTTATSFTDKSVSSNKTYTYTVKAYYGKTYSGWYSSGKSATFLKAPVISAISNTATGVLIKWGKVTGATKYYVYRKTTGSWTRLTSTSDLNYTDKTAEPGITYTYTVKALKADLASSYYTNKKIKRLDKPELLSLNAAKGKNTLRFGKVEGANSYTVYRKTNNGAWENIANTTSTTFVDKKVEKGVTYTYTVKAVSGSSKSAHNSTGLKVKAK